MGGTTAALNPAEAETIDTEPRCFGQNYGSVAVQVPPPPSFRCEEPESSEADRVRQHTRPPEDQKGL